MRRFLFTIILASFLSAKASYAESIPRPHGWVNDFAEVVSADYRDKMDALIRELEQKTSAEIMVVTVASIAPYDEKSYARMIFDSWKPGKRGRDNGVLVLLAVKERRWRIETGYGVEGILPDGLCGNIGRDYMAPYFKKDKYGEGLYSGVMAIGSVIAKDAGLDISFKSSLGRADTFDKPPIFLYLFVPIFFFVWNLPWPVFIGLPFTLLFALVFFQMSPSLGFLTCVAYIAAQIFRYGYWRSLPVNRRNKFFGAQTYGGTFTTGGFGGGFGGGGFGGGFGGGGGGGGGGAGGGF